MNIALVILHADPMRGGAERYTIDLAAALARREHHVSLVATHFADPPAGVKLVELPARGFTRAARYRRMLDSLDLHLRQTPYHIVHAMFPVRQCHVYHPHAGMAAAAVAGRPLQTLLNPRRRAMARIEHRLLNSPHPPVVLCLSDYVKQSVLQHYPSLPPSRLATLFNAVDLDLFDPDVQHGGQKLRAARGIGPNDVLALIVAQDFVRKGVPQAIAATRQLNARRAPGQPPLKLLVVGSGRHHPDADDPNIIFVGADRKIARYYGAADFFVLPTRHDPCSLVVLEALAMGLPVISTRFNGACEIMTDGIHGFVLSDPDDLAALSQAMYKLLDPHLRARMSDACRQLRPKLSFEHHVDRLLQIYQSCRVESDNRG
ncbi:glycosyltransferase family 4 protein [Fontivita pretiosa]|uniref:glycosyltransferase family 4 protein n=1 Tax=Fontivita pretiosa TaxID=2989684 RepID=UPI003D16CE67